MPPLSKLRLWAVCAVAAPGLAAGLSHGAELRTVNIDFGPGRAYAGADGVLSSPGGTLWNGAEPSDFGFTQPFRGPGAPFRDEFGADVDEFFLWRNATATNLTTRTGLTSPATTTSGVGADGVHTTTLRTQLVIRGLAPQFSDQAELVLYFTQPDFIGGGFGARRYLFLDTLGQPLGQGDVTVSPTQHGYAAHITAPPLTQVPFAGPDDRSPWGYYLRIDEGLTLTGLQLRARFAVPEPASCVMLLTLSVAALLRCDRTRQIV